MTYSDTKGSFPSHFKVDTDNKKSKMTATSANTEHSAAEQHSSWWARKWSYAIYDYGLYCYFVVFLITVNHVFCCFLLFFNVDFPAVYSSLRRLEWIIFNLLPITHFSSGYLKGMYSRRHHNTDPYLNNCEGWLPVPNDKCDHFHNNMGVWVIGVQLFIIWWQFGEV